MKARRVSTLVLCVVAVFVAPLLMAQERAPVEVSGGYQYLFDIPATLSVPQGWYVGAGFNATDWLAIVGEFSRSALTEENVDYRVFNTMGGVRFRKGGFFGQFLVGQFALEYDEAGDDYFLQITETHTAIQPGVGWDIGVTRRVSARIQVDYRHLLSDEDRYGRELRVAAGVSVAIGGS